MCKASLRAKWRRLPQELCGHEFSASSIGRIHKSLDGEFVSRGIHWKKPNLSDSGRRHEKMREDGVIRSHAVPVAIGMNEEGEVCAGGGVSQRESDSWKEFIAPPPTRAARR
jgi:putative transposase